MNHETILPPLHLIICREQDDQPTANLADAIQRAFRGNLTQEDTYLATISDLPVPIRNFSGYPRDFVPAAFLDQALHTLVVLLVNDKMIANTDWKNWIKGCEEHVAKADGRHRIIALCATEKIKKSFRLVKHQPDRRFTEKIGYDDKQSNEEWAFGEHAERPAWFALYILQACRHLLAKPVFDSGDDKEKLKLRLFISHAKRDSLPLANSLRSALKQKQYFAVWYDAEDLDAVEDWRTAIKEGVNNSVVVVLRTEQYDTRPWCRQEFLWADQCAVPIVVVEARNSLEYAADALAAGRVPTVRIPDGNLFRVLFTALKESLRILQLERRLAQLRRPRTGHIGIREAKKSFLIPYTPNLRNLTYAAKVVAGVRRKSKKGYPGYNVILYADPPLQTELYQASKSYLQDRCGMTYLLTPTLLPFWNVTARTARTAPGKLPTRSLLRRRINISISEYEPDLKRLGMTNHEMNSFVVQIAQAMVANEAIVCFGHDWREDGVMQEIYRFGEEHQDVVLTEDERSGVIENYCFWGQEPGLGERERGHLRGIIDIIECERPADPRLSEYKTLGAIPEILRGYALARALTVMRRKMTDSVFARVCLGGRDMDPEEPENAPAGRCPGVLEEALLSCLADQPLYLAGLLGGVTQQVINAIEGRDAHLEFDLLKSESRSKVAAAYEDPQLGRKPNLGARLTRSQLRRIYLYDGLLTTGEILGVLGLYGIKRLSDNNGLSQTENRYLFNAATIDEVLGWVLTGLARLRKTEATSKTSPRRGRR